MRTVSEEQPTVKQESKVSDPKLEVFSVKLKSGKNISIREMTGKDLVYIEEELVNMGETRKSFHIIELLNVGEEKISYDEIESLGVRDIKAISELVAKANGDTFGSYEEPPK